MQTKQIKEASTIPKGWGFFVAFFSGLPPVLFDFFCPKVFFAGEIVCNSIRLHGVAFHDPHSFVDTIRTYKVCFPNMGSGFTQFRVKASGIVFCYVSLIRNRYAVDGVFCPVNFFPFLEESSSSTVLASRFVLIGWGGVTFAFYKCGKLPDLVQFFFSVLVTVKMSRNSYWVSVCLLDVIKLFDVRINPFLIV